MSIILYATISSKYIVLVNFAVAKFYSHSIFITHKSYLWFRITQADWQNIIIINVTLSAFKLDLQFRLVCSISVLICVGDVRTFTTFTTVGSTHCDGGGKASLNVHFIAFLLRIRVLFFLNNSQLLTGSLNPNRSVLYSIYLYLHLYTFKSV